MSMDAIVVVLMAAAFCVFAVVLFWADLKTRQPTKLP